jgi:hypothetical protein
MNYRILDKQVKVFSRELKNNIGLDDTEIGKVATLIAAEVRFLNPSSKSEVLSSSPVPLDSRVEELLAFQAWMDFVSSIKANPTITRAQVIVQNYICFVYLSEACFRALRKVSPPESVTRRCCKYLTDNPLRAFRNSIAHSNWIYRDDFSGLVFWARKGDDPKEPMSRFEVSQSELNFWQCLSRVVAYAAYTSLHDIHTAG